MNKVSILAVLVIVYLSSCLTQKRCYDRFPVIADTVRVATTKDSIVYRDTVIAVIIPGQTKYDTVKIPCPPPAPGFIPDTAKAETSLARALAWYSYPYIRLKLIQKDTIIMARLDSAIREATHWRYEYEKIVAIVPEKTPIPKIYKITFWMCIGMVLLFFVLLLSWRFLK